LLLKVDEKKMTKKTHDGTVAVLGGGTAKVKWGEVRGEVLGGIRVF